MNFATYFRLFARWFWLIGLAILVSGGAAYYVARKQPPLYQAMATIKVGNTERLANPPGSLMQDIEVLANSYFVQMKTRPYLQSIIKRADLTMSTDDLAASFTTAMKSGTPFFDITASNGNPEIAAKMANAIADEFVALTAPGKQTREKNLADAQTQADSISKQITSDQADLETINTCLKVASCYDPILVSQQADLSAKITSEQSALVGFRSQAIALTDQGNINELNIAQSAEVPLRSTGGSTLKDAGIAGGIGGALSIGIIALLEQLNTTIRSSSEIPSLLRLPVLGLIPLYGRRNSYKKRLVSWITPSSKAAEAFRVLRGNLMYIEKDRLKTNQRCYIISSSRTGEGKSVTAANLAVAFSTIGQRVILIDADIRQPAQHLIFNVENGQGLSDILSFNPQIDETQPMMTGDPTLDDTFFSTFKNADDNALLSIHSSATSLFYTIPDTLPIQKTEIPRLHVITAGTSKKNPADLVGSVKMKELVDHLIAKEGFDIIVIDSPGVLEVSDSSVLAATVAAPVILVAEEDRTSRNDAAMAVQRFSVLSLPVLGVILNRAKSSAVAEHPGGPGVTQEMLALGRGDTQRQPSIQ